MQRLRIGLVAGEPSGDLLGAGVIRALRESCDELVLEGVGGPHMEAQGLRSMVPMERLAVMGLVDPLKRLPELLRIRRSVLQHFCSHPPDVFLGIDSPDFNLTLERKLRRAGVPTAHLVSPSVWAWRRGRLRTIAKSVDQMLCLFPFETAIYEDHGISARYVGHPLADEIPLPVTQAEARARIGLESAGKIVALLPGSRAGEIRQLAPLFLQVAEALWRENPSMVFVLPAASALRQAELSAYLLAHPQLPVYVLAGQAQDAMAAADAVLLAAGTATLEAALLKRPMVVAYRMGAVSWCVLSRLVHSRYIALPNILADASLVPELLQRDASPEALAQALRAQLAAPGLTPEVAVRFDSLHGQLRQNCPNQVAAALLALIARKAGKA